MVKLEMESRAPSHITGFFEICPDPDPLRMGSRGAGLVLSSGVRTKVCRARVTELFINGISAEAKTSRDVVERLAVEPVRVETTLEVPIGGGFGASGSAALSTAFAIGQLLELEHTPSMLAQIAHISEVENKTGLGDVLSMTHGGLVVRTHPGAPNIGKVKKFIIEGLKIAYVHMGPLSTKETLSDTSAITRINTAGRKALKAFLIKPTLENFFHESKVFAHETGLINDRVGDAIEAVESEGGSAAMAMIGDTVFTVGPHGPLKEFGEVRFTELQNTGTLFP